MTVDLERVKELLDELAKNTAPYGRWERSARKEINTELEAIVYGELDVRGPCTARWLSHTVGMSPRKVASLLTSMRHKGKVRIVDIYNDTKVWDVVR